jgi:hypothetical protein
MRQSISVGFLLAVFVMSGCGADTDMLRTRAAYDFKCPQDRLTLVELNAGQAVTGEGATYGVEGCGHRGTYVQPNGQGTWVLNSTEEHDGAKSTE